MKKNPIRTSTSVRMNKGQSVVANAANSHVWLDFFNGDKIGCPLVIFLPAGTSAIITAKIAAAFNEALSS
jgi:hypothetical protein